MGPVFYVEEAGSIEAFQVKQTKLQRKKNTLWAMGAPKWWNFRDAEKYLPESVSILPEILPFEVVVITATLSSKMQGPDQVLHIVPDNLGK